MPAGNPTIDRFETLECVEHDGVIRSLTRLARVVGLTNTDYTVLWSALSNAGIPAYASALVTGVTAVDQNFSALVLVDRAARIVEMDRVVDVTLKYAHLLDGPNQNLFNPLGLFFPGVLFTKGRSSVVQKPTNFYQPYGITSIPRQQITVSNTFPLTDEQLPGKNQIQGGEVTLPFPQSNVHLEGFAYVANPWAYKRQIHRKLNSSVWMGEPARTWLCSEVQFEVLNPSPTTVPVGITASTPLYKFMFEFQHDPDSFDPTVVFKDARTGLPPSDVQSPTIDEVFLPANVAVSNQTEDPYTLATVPAGVWNVPCLAAINFNAFFASLFEGFEPF